MGLAVEKSRTIVSALILGHRVTAQDVAWLRREVFAEGEVTRDSAEELFAVARAAMNNSPEWVELFVELITDHVVWQSRPTGVVSDEEARWLIERADACRSVEALAALVNVLAEADRVPAMVRRSGAGARRPVAKRGGGLKGEGGLTAARPPLSTMVTTSTGGEIERRFRLTKEALVRRRLRPPLSCSSIVVFAHFTCQTRFALKDCAKENQSFGALDVGARSTENGLFLASVTMPAQRL